MGKTYRFLASIDEASAVLDWFRSSPERPVESAHNGGYLLYFQDFGPFEFDSKKSPIVSIVMPVRKRGVLTTIGEVHFLATPLSAFPALNKVNKRFRSWLAKNPCVFSRRAGFLGEWDYYLEGSSRNWDSDVFALPAGLAALRDGSYFVAAADNDARLDVVCRALQLRGVNGVQPQVMPT